MKILVISDIHGEKNRVKRLVQKLRPDYIFFAGDGLSIFEEETSTCPPERIFAVKGNCDIFTKHTTSLTFELEGIKFLLTHGHNFKVKTDLTHLYEYAKAEEVDFVCFGHTHNSYNQSINNIKFFNPGSLGGDKNSKNSFGILEINDKKITAKIEFF